MGPCGGNPAPAALCPRRLAAQGLGVTATGVFPSDEWVGVSGPCEDVRSARFQQLRAVLCC